MFYASGRPHSQRFPIYTSYSLEWHIQTSAIRSSPSSALEDTYLSQTETSSSVSSHSSITMADASTREMDPTEPRRSEKRRPGRRPPDSGSIRRFSRETRRGRPSFDAPDELQVDSSSSRKSLNCSLTLREAIKSDMGPQDPFVDLDPREEKEPRSPNRSEWVPRRP